VLSNALRYTDSGGRVKVSVTVIERECVVAVTDSGIGIDEADVPRVFDRFWRARAARERATAGSGVGLALVRDLVLAHEGRVEVVSRPGSGSRFSVHLPLHTSAEPDEPLRPAFAAGETAAAVAAWKLQRVAEIAGAARAELP
jgi:signal transduction histidine kinase